ncbi:hypothetical protein HGRIS_013299 [Hohenbuehelia grisea]|uniref:High-temperature-induced dauer-formation protein n=1 Tax=Hohenbuehelia grisea TaxID=104357 RepID=A0ABR3IVB0_9AGAR
MIVSNLIRSPLQTENLISLVRRVLLDAPENVATLIRVITAKLFNLVSDHTFPSTHTASVTSFASSFIKTTTGSAERNTTKEVLNCLRILQRVLPVVFEVDGESNLFETEVLWKKQEVQDLDDEAPGAPRFVIDDDDSENGDAEAPKDQTDSSKSTKTLPSLGERLFSCLFDLLYCCGFTLPQKFQVDHHKITHVIWEKGVGSTAEPGPNHMYDANKAEVLRLLQVLLSRQIYVPPSSLFSKPSRFSLHFVQNTPRRDVLTLLCSLLNTAMNASTHSATTIGSVAGKLPYNHLVFKGEDPRSALVIMCLQVLSALLDFQSGSARDKSSGFEENRTFSPTVRTNAFRYFLMKLHRTQDLEFILSGILRIFEDYMASVNNLLPGAKKAIPYQADTVFFLWKMIDLNKKFREYLLASDKSTTVLAHLLCYAVEIKDKPEQHGLCRALSYIIQTLSAERAFGLSLSGPLKVPIPVKWHNGGTAGDFLINAVYSIIATTSGTLSSIYPALIIALSNCAPYFKNLTVTSSARLLQLFTSFSNPLFLLADEGHPRLLFFMLEVFNAIILHNLSENPHLVYNILSAHRTFEDLGTFTLTKGLREIRRVQQAKEEQIKKGDQDAKAQTKAGSLDGDEPTPGDEKARLLERESQDRLSQSTDNILGAQQPTRSDNASPPTAETTADEPAVSHPLISEKARGKMKERRSMSLDTTSSADRVTASNVGRNGFIPTQEWVTSWQQGLPMDCVMLVIAELLPKIQEMQASRPKAISTAKIIDFLGNVTLQHVLPPVQPLTPRPFMWSDTSIVWLTSLIWGEIYVRGMSPFGIWNSTNVRLFYVKHSQAQQRQLTVAVSNAVGGILGRTNSGDLMSPSRTRA